jgi:hypothetical protein
MSFSEITFNELLNTPRAAFGKVAKVQGFEAAYQQLEHLVLKYAEKHANKDGEIDDVLNQETDDVRDVLCDCAIEAALASTDPTALRRLFEIGVHGSENYWVKDSRTRTKPRELFREMQEKLDRGDEDAMSEWIAAEAANNNGPCTVEVHHRRQVIVKKSFPAYVMPPSDPNEGKIITP